MKTSPAASLKEAVSQEMGLKFLEDNRDRNFLIQNTNENP